MKKIAFLLLLLLPVLAAAADQVPYKATLASTSLPVITEGSEDRCGPVPTPPEAPPLRWWVMTIRSVGHSTLMGLTINEQSHCFALPIFITDPNTPPPVGSEVLFSSGIGTLTAANGDTITGTYEGSMLATTAGMVITGQFHTRGGTGRFEGATGDGDAFGVQGPGGAAMTISGTMTAPGSLKKNK